jgi:Domain of unknown function (DUF4189)
MHPFVKCLALVVLCTSSMKTLAEGNCPPGYYQTPSRDFVGCAPLPGYGSTTPPDPGPSWSSRWSAIATASGGILGVAENSSSRRKAEKAAMKQCKAKKGQDCSISLSFGNQCGALAWGDTLSYSIAAVELAAAEVQALQNCSKRTQNCRVFYSACSYPQRIR